MRLMQDFPMRKQEQIPSSVVLTLEIIQNYLTHLCGKNAAANTMERYRQNLKIFYEALPEDKCVDRYTLVKWRNELLQRGYAVRSVNVYVSTANSLLAYLGFRELQLPQQIEPEKLLQPELTRAEYLTLLQAARAEQKERVYLLIKLFATTGISVQDIDKVTVESVQGNCIDAMSGDKQKPVLLTDFLRQELLSYADHMEIEQGPLFITRDGNPLERTNVTASIRQLCQNAGIPPEKGNPRCLKRLYQTTRLEIEQDINRLVEQAHERILEVEQQIVGWNPRNMGKGTGKDRAG